MASMRVRNLILVLGDQLDAASSVFEGIDPRRDVVWMAEVAHEATQVWSSQPRIAVFLAAMRHFRDALRASGLQVRYHALDQHAHATLEDALAHELEQLQPDKVIAVRPGEWRLAQSLPQVVARAGRVWAERPDLHFHCDPADFADWARGRRTLRMEDFYHWIRRREDVLMDGAQPAGGRWNFDADNRKSFGKAGPRGLPMPQAFAPDAVTADVIALVRARFGDHPGDLSRFDWPVTQDQAQQALDDFIALRLPHFGRHQDAMWTDQPWLFHSLLSAAMNMKLLSPRAVVAAATEAWRQGRAPLASVEGFVRQVIGWREFVRGVYWLRMPGMAQDNVLHAQQPLPAFYWTGRTHMVCMRQSLQQSLQLGYAHHIQRLMVTGCFALMLGVEPAQVHAWYLAVYVDAVEWVELPNTLGMSQFADGGAMVSKPYVASGRYIQRMSNYCSGCRYDPGQALGERGCPFTTLYWDFLMRHQQRFADHPRAAMQWRSLERLDADQRAAIAERAAHIRTTLAELSPGLR